MGDKIIGFFVVVSLIISAVVAFKVNHPKTKKCRYCRSRVDGRARVCPHCRRNIGTHSEFFIPFILTFMGIMVLAMVVIGLIGSLF